MKIEWDAKDDTLIPCKKGTRARLLDMCKKKYTYDVFLNKMLDLWETHGEK